MTGSVLDKTFKVFGKQASGLMNKVAPRWTQSKIDSLLFESDKQQAKSIRVPRGFTEYSIKTRDGKLAAYQIGSGPRVVFVHGWGGSGSQFFPLMKGLSQCGFTAISFDHLGHGKSEGKTANLDQFVKTTTEVLHFTKKHANAGISAIVGHSTGCIAIANARQNLVENVPLFLISPIFNYKLFFLKKLVKLNLHADILKQYAADFTQVYKAQFAKLELAKQLERYSDVCVIAHDKLDSESPISDSVKFCQKFPLTKLMSTAEYNHIRIINSESVWRELKSHLNYEDTTINYAHKILKDPEVDS